MKIDSTNTQKKMCVCVCLSCLCCGDSVILTHTWAPVGVRLGLVAMGVFESTHTG